MPNGGGGPFGKNGQFGDAVIDQPIPGFFLGQPGMPAPGRKVLGDVLAAGGGFARFEPGEIPEMKLVRFRSLGCYPLSAAVDSPAATLEDIVTEMKNTRVSERAGRLIDKDQDASMEKKKREGYF